MEVPVDCLRDLLGCLSVGKVADATVSTSARRRAKPSYCGSRALSARKRER